MHTPSFVAYFLVQNLVSRTTSLIHLWTETRLKIWSKSTYHRVSHLPNSRKAPLQVMPLVIETGHYLATRNGLIKARGCIL